jgi:Family of unknown function (DUF6173)
MSDEIMTTAEVVEASAMRLGSAIHTAPRNCPSPEQEPLPDSIGKKPIDQKSPAEWAYQRLILYIKNFEQTLDSEQEVAMSFTDTGGGFLRIEGLGYFDPDIVTFYGTDQTGARVQLVQHVSQLNVLLRTMPKAVETDEPRRIGFELAKALEEDEQA